MEPPFRPFVGDDGRIEPELLELYRQEIESQSTFACMAMDRMVTVERLVQRDFDHEKPTSPGITLEYWAAVQALLVAAANVSKLLWPPDSSSLGAVPDRGTQLRRLLAIADNSPLRDRTARNHAEHYDERLERWAARTTRRDFVDMSTGPILRVLEQGIELGDVMRFFDPDERKLYMAGDVFELNPLRAALVDVRERSVEARESIARMYGARQD